MQKDLHCILIDFLGCGRSDRTASSPSDIWIDEARQVVCLVQHLELDEVSLIGTSGGAWVVMNAAMMMKGFIRRPYIGQQFLFRPDKGKGKCNER